MLGERKSIVEQILGTHPAIEQEVQGSLIAGAS